MIAMLRYLKRMIFTLSLFSYCSLLFAGDLDISSRWGCLHSPRSNLPICFSESMCIRRMSSVFSHFVFQLRFCNLLRIYVSFIHEGRGDC